MTSNAGASHCHGIGAVRLGAERLKVARVRRRVQPAHLWSYEVEGAAAKMASRRASPIRVSDLPADSASSRLASSTVCAVEACRALSARRETSCRLASWRRATPTDSGSEPAASNRRATLDGVGRAPGALYKHSSTRAATR